jgi:hypothetical protein
MKNKLFGEAPLLRLAVCMMAGIVIGNHVEAGMWLLPVLAGTLALALLLWKEALLQSVAIAVCFVLLGWLLTERQRASLRVQWPENEVRYEAVVLSEPQEKPKTMAVDIMLIESGQKLKGYIYKDERSRGLRIGDGLRIQSQINANGWSSESRQTRLDGRVVTDELTKCQTLCAMKRVLNKFWDCQCTATVIVSPDRDFKSSQTFMMVNGYIMRTEPGKPNRETAATPAKGS